MTAGFAFRHIRIPACDGTGHACEACSDAAGRCLPWPCDYAETAVGTEPGAEPPVQRAAPRRSEAARKAAPVSLPAAGAEADPHVSCESVHACADVDALRARLAAVLAVASRHHAHAAARGLGQPDWVDDVRGAVGPDGA